MKKTAALFVLLIVPVAALAQERPLSPPRQSPVPLTDKDQRARTEEEAKKAEEANKKPVAATPPAMTAPSIKMPAALVNRHVSTGNAALDSLIQEAAARNGLDPCLIVSLMRAESAFSSTAVSPKGASGLMQLMPDTAARFGVKNIFDVRENVFAGTRYLRWLLDRFGGDVRLALAGYNAGEGAVEYYGNRIPPFLETQNYVRIIYGRYSAAHAGSFVEAPAAPVKQESKPIEAAAEKPPTYNQIIRFTSTNGDAAGKSGK